MFNDAITVEEALKCFTENADPEAEKRLTGCGLFQESIRITMEMNTRYHTPEELRELMSHLTGKTVDDTFRIFPPFTADFGKNITIGKDVFINSGCRFQDQGGIVIGDGAPARLLKRITQGSAV